MGRSSAERHPAGKDRRQGCGMMNHDASSVSTAALFYASVLLLGIPCLIVLTIAGVRSRWAAITAVVASLGLQTFHSLEHVVQSAVWAKNPLAPGYMSPLAKQAAAGLESVAASAFGITGRSTLGMELLHLVGNTLFFIGIVALVVGQPFASRRRAALYAATFEGIHLFEHAVLTATTIAGFPAWGSSTLYNTISGSQLSTHRIWWHLVMNIAALALTVHAVKGSEYTKAVRNAAVTLLVLAGTTPVLMAHFFAVPMSGFASTAQFFSFPTLTALLVSPITMTALLIFADAGKRNPPAVRP